MKPTLDDLINFLFVCGAGAVLFTVLYIAELCAKLYIRWMGGGQ